MAEFEVRWLDGENGTRRRLLHADGPGQAAALLGVPPQRVLSVRPAPARTPARRRGTLDLRLFAQELSVLLRSGLPLTEALLTLREKDGGATVLEQVQSALQQGLPLSQALQQAGPPFDALFIAVVAASERTGQLATTLQAHAAWLAWSQALRARLVAAAIYPLMLLGAGAAVVMFLLLYVLPRFAGIFDGMDRELPAASRWLMSLGVAAHAHPRLSLVLAALLPLAALMVRRWPAARAGAGRLLWHSPWLGPRLRVLSLARLYRCLALLLEAGVPVLQALRLVPGVVDPALRPALHAAAGDVAQGRRLSQALQERALATPVALRMLRVGEGSGMLAPMLERAATFHDDEIARLGELVTRTVNPVLMLVMGVVIGGIVVLMYLPIFTLMEQVQ